MAKTKQVVQPVSTMGLQWWMTKGRGCGPGAIAGGVYVSVAPERFGEKHPVWEFVIDPTYLIPEDKDDFPLAAVNMLLKSRGQVNRDGNEIYDLYDWIGSSGYPNVLDWLLEVQQLGFHQKINPDILQWLTPESYYFAVHERAAFEDPTPAYDDHERFLHPDQPKCPAEVPQHLEIDHAALLNGESMLHLGTCIGLFFNDVIKGTKPEKDSRITIREMPSFSWNGFVPADPQAKHLPAVFFRLPIGRIAQFLVYEDTQNATHEDALAELEKLDAKMKRVKLVKLE